MRLIVTKATGPMILELWTKVLASLGGKTNPIPLDIV
jgi:hypothetical protein